MWSSQGVLTHESSKQSVVVAKRPCGVSLRPWVQVETRWKECKIQQAQGYLSVYSKKLRFRSWIAYFSEQQKASFQRSNKQKQLCSNSLYCWCYWQSLHIFIIHYCRTKECLEYKKKIKRVTCYMRCLWI